MFTTATHPMPGVSEITNHLERVAELHLNGNYEGTDTAMLVDLAVLHGMAIALLAAHEMRSSESRTLPDKIENGRKG